MCGSPRRFRRRRRWGKRDGVSPQVFAFPVDITWAEHAEVDGFTERVGNGIEGRFEGGEFHLPPFEAAAAKDPSKESGAVGQPEVLAGHFADSK